MNTITDRIIVCGGGLAGLSAAVTALERGAKVTLLEKAPQLGGTTVLSGGLVWTFKDFDEARSRITHGDAALQWLVYDGVSGARDWLAGLGVKLGLLEDVMGHGQGQSVDLAQMIEILARHFNALGGELRLETALESLTCMNGAIRGVNMLRDGKLTELQAGAVILATGGMQGNPELLARYVVRDPNNLALRASPWSTGDGFLAATRIGAAASPGLGSFYGHALVASPARYGWLQLRDASQYYGRLSVALNLHGERFADESDGTGEEALNQHLAQQPMGRGVYVVDEESIDLYPNPGREVVTRAIIARARAMGGFVIEANTLEALCSGLAPLGIPVNRALATLREFNAALEGGRADELMPARRQNRKPLTHPPFRAVAVQAAITFTMGGVQVDEKARVLWRAGGTSPFAAAPVSRAYANIDGPAVKVGSEYRQMAVRGLFAAGNDVGNISHFGYMGGLASALTMGRTAGEEAARLVATSSV